MARFSVSSLNSINLVSVYQYNRSGSVFMSSLLDGHPEILSFPCYLTPLLGYWRNTIAGNNFSDHQVVAQFATDFAGLADAELGGPIPSMSDRMGEELGLSSLGPDKTDVLRIDIEQLVQNMLKWMSALDASQSQFRRFFVALHAALYDTNDLPVSSQPLYIAYQHHSCNLIDQQMMAEHFPDVRFLQTIREPVQAFGSVLASWFDEQQASVNLLGKGFGGMFAFAKPHYQRLSAQYRLLKLEDIHQQPVQSLQKVADWLGVAWDDALRHSSFAGHQWHNLKKRQHISGFNQTVINKKHSDLFDEFDRQRLNSLVRRLHEEWDYDAVDGYFPDSELAESVKTQPFGFERQLARYQLLHQGLEDSSDAIESLVWKNRETLFSMQLDYALSQRDRLNSSVIRL